MCGIAGFSNLEENYLYSREKWERVLNQMNQVQKHRGPDDEGYYLDKTCGLGHVRLSIIDLKNGHQPMIRKKDYRECAIIFNGEIYNMLSLRKELEKKGARFETNSDTEVILVGYMRYGTSFVKRLNGIFSIAIWDGMLEKLFLFRDRLGVKPLFYTELGNTLIFASEIKGLFAYPGVKPVIDREGLGEIFGLGPAKTYGKGVFKNVKEVLPGHFLEYEKEGLKDHTFWQLEGKPHEDSLQNTIEKTSWLIHDAVKMQMLSDIPISTFLSGGVDSSLVTSICAKELHKQGKQLNTFSFDFHNNHQYFQANAFQPSEDRPWVDRMVEYAETRHIYLECRNMELISYLYKAVDARDLPCMADVESSMLYFCSKVVDYNKVTLTGECADEIFGGYPWFHKKECFEADNFPWSMDMEPRKMLLRDDILEKVDLEAYSKEAYQRTIKETPKLYGEDKIEARRREISYLNLHWFMTTLLDRMDRTSMYSGLEARVPFADHRIVEYLYNVPWEMKCKDGIVKGLLRAAGEKDLPEEVLYRRKSPYPKTYDPTYEKLLSVELQKVMQKKTSPIIQLIDPVKLENFLNSPKDYGKPWYGQLMAGPQMIAFLLQVNYWLQAYEITLEI
ncbi:MULTISPECIES: asparagine synthase (glutamine-hydrolyzing) [Anaerostipes]|uniref:asparagine synthase (glutamine-hydrolyzing) n=1 Tax=Anaerostipes TaxID=207244 RepID=UPI001C1E1A8B|nr:MULTISPECIES: asparagine synthase (glutamine-hydrolyzing) [Anaerostipes]MCI5623383.1 asparagine synthase (glutamine-hydrolyzing) [Anaerostipes sp.]